MGRALPSCLARQKTWWQQEQGILAYYIMAGVYNDKPEYLRYAREGSAFYNGWFLDYDAGGIYFNVLSNGQPYALGGEREKEAIPWLVILLRALLPCSNLFKLIGEQGTDGSTSTGSSGLAGQQTPGCSRSATCWQC